MKRPTNVCKILGVAAAVAVVAHLTAGTAYAGLILDGGFETGFGDWTIVAPPDAVYVGGNAHSGHYAGWFGSVKSDGAIEETFETEPGASYTVDFWLAHGATDRANDFSVFWNDTPLLQLVNASRFNYTHFSFLETATSDATTLIIEGREVPDYFYIDDIQVAPSVIGSAVTPEPATLVLVGTGIGAVARRWRKSARARAC